MTYAVVVYWESGRADFIGGLTLPEAHEIEDIYQTKRVSRTQIAREK